MNWAERVVSLIAETPSGAEGSGAAEDLARELEEALAEAVEMEEIERILSASAMLLRASAARGKLVLAEREPLSSRGGAPLPSSAAVRALGVGATGRSFLSVLRAAWKPGFSPALFLLDVESARAVELPAEAISCVLEIQAALDLGGAPRYGALLRSAYRAADGREFVAAAARPSDPASEARISVHVVASAEDPLSEVLPDLLFDLREALGRGKRGTVALHLVSKRSPRLRGGIRETLLELEKTRPFENAFVVLGPLEPDLERVARFLELTAMAPEVLAEGRGEVVRGWFSSYGIATLPSLKDKPVEEALALLDSAYRAADPSWVPANAVLSEIAPEKPFLLYPPEDPPPEEAWRYCPEFVAVPIPGIAPTICRVQRGLGLEDLRLF